MCLRPTIFFLAYRLQLPLVCITVVMKTMAERKGICVKRQECLLCTMQVEMDEPRTVACEKNVASGIILCYGGLPEAK
jgi:hypothetical protein